MHLRQVQPEFRDVEDNGPPGAAYVSKSNAKFLQGRGASENMDKDFDRRSNVYQCSPRRCGRD